MHNRQAYQVLRPLTDQKYSYRERFLEQMTGK